MDDLFPKFQKSIENLIEDEEGNIPGKKLLVLGTMMVVLGTLLNMDAFAVHSSHSVHGSHDSHTSHASGSEGSQGSQDTHTNHSSHESHVSHTSHSNTSSHSNSLYSAEGDVTYSAPAASDISGVEAAPVAVAADTFKLPDVNQNIEVPNGTPASQIMPSLAVPSSSVGAKIDAGELHAPSPTDDVL